MKNFVVLIAFVFSLSLAANASDSKQAAPAVPDAPKPVLLTIDKMPEGVYKLDPVHYNVYFKISHSGGMSYPMYRFTRVDATLNLDPKNPEKSSVSVNIDPKSLKSDYLVNRDYSSNENYKTRDWDEELITKPFWFDTAKFPEMTFVSTKIKKTGKNTGVMFGNLTMRGITKEIKLDVKFNGALPLHGGYKQPYVGFSAKGVINRTDFGLMAYLGITRPEVEVFVEAEFVKEAK